MGIDISQLGKDAQAQVMAKMAVQEVKKRSKYGNRKVVRDGIKFDSERVVCYVSQYRNLFCPVL
jgi:hypothetical protein